MHNTRARAVGPADIAPHGCPRLASARRTPMWLGRFPAAGNSWGPRQRRHTMVDDSRSSPESPRTSLSRVAISSCVGTTIEWYDFFIYGTAAALVFPTVFFPALGPAAGTVASLASLGVAFVARPLGALVCGHFGDRYGRKNTLIATLMLMGIATVLIGLLPTAAMIGVLAPVLLTTLRFLQGIAVGGEWAGANLLTAEYAPPSRRGFFAVFPQLGPAIAFALSSATFLIVDLAVGSGSPAFVSYGWRIPFLCSAVLVVLGLYVRVSVEETPAFRQRLAEVQAGGAAPVRAPVRVLFAAQRREVLLGGGALTILFALFYVATAYLTSFGTSDDGAGLSRTLVLGLGIVASGVLAVTTLVGGFCSDRYGRRRTMLTGFAVTIPAALVLYTWIGAGSAWALGVALCATLALYGVAYGPAGAYLPELFRTEYRYSGAGVAYSLGGVLGGAVVPPAAVSLAAAYGTFAVGVLLAVLAVGSLACLLALPESASGHRGSIDRTDAAVLT
ncbi:MFS transporter [Pseudonocardia sichuanensis]